MAIGQESDNASASRKGIDTRYPQQKDYVSQVPDMFELDSILNSIKNLPERKPITSNTEFNVPFNTELPVIPEQKVKNINPDNYPIGRDYKGQIYKLPVSTNPWFTEDEARRANTLGLANQIPSNPQPIQPIAQAKKTASTNRLFGGNRKIDLTEPEYANDTPMDMLKKMSVAQQLLAMQDRDQENQKVNIDPMKRMFDIEDSRYAVSTGQKAPLTNQDTSGNRLSAEEISALKNKEAIDRLSSTLGIISLGENVRYAKDKTNIDKSQLDLLRDKFRFEKYIEPEKINASTYAAKLGADVKMAEIAAIQNASRKLENGEITLQDYYKFVTDFSKTQGVTDAKELTKLGTSAGVAANESARNSDAINRARRLEEKLQQMRGNKNVK